MIKVTEQLARFIVETEFDDIPREAIAKAKELLIDTVGVTLAGSAQPLSEIMLNYIKEIGGIPECTIIGKEGRTSATNAALINGTMAHALDFDDVMMGGHDGAIIVPVVLSLGEKLKLSGKKCLEALVVGVEIWGALTNGCNITTSVSFLSHSMTIYGCMSAVASASKLLGLDIDQTNTAIGIAASHVSGVRENIGTMVKALHAGLAARAGVSSAMLAKAGFTGQKGIIESPRGWGNAIIGQGRFDPEKMVKDLGKVYRTSSSIQFKRYPCCWAQHRVIEAIFHLMKEHNISYDDIDIVTIDHAYNNAGLLMFSKPDTPLRGKFSAQYTAAAAILDGKIDIDTYSDSRYPDPKLDEAMEKIRVVIHTDWPMERPGPPAPVSIKLNDRRVYTHQVTVLPGTSKMPFSKDEFYGKYEVCAKLALSGEKAKKALEMIEKFEEVADCAELMDMVGTDGREQTSREKRSVRIMKQGGGMDGQ
jgi:2-methylcitrate dehydratase PrpD